MQITSEVSKILKSYVYVYIDPRNGKPFYIGKGKGGRLFAHLKNHSDLGKVTEKKKLAKIAEIRRSGKEPRIEILRYGVADSEAQLVEAVSIDLNGVANLTNLKSGEHKGSFGRITSQRVITMLTAKKVKVKHKAILITINKLYRSDMSPEELYEVTRGIWKVGEASRNKVEFAMSIYQGIVLEVYRIEQWYPAGTLKYKTRDSSDFKNSGRWEFSGSVAKDIRDEYLDFSVGKAGQNPIRYVNIS